MNELFYIAHIDQSVDFRFFTVYYYGGVRKIISFTISVENFDIAISKITKRCTFVPETPYEFKFTVDEFNKDFINNDCEKIFKLKPRDFFAFLIKRTLYSYVAKINKFNQIEFIRDETKDYPDSIRKKNKSTAGISWTTILSCRASFVYENNDPKAMNLFNIDKYNKEIKKVEMDLSEYLKAPKEITFDYLGLNPYQLEFDFGES